MYFSFFQDILPSPLIAPQYPQMNGPRNDLIKKKWPKFHAQHPDMPPRVRRRFYFDRWWHEHMKAEGKSAKDILKEYHQTKVSKKCEKPSMGVKIKLESAWQDLRIFLTRSYSNNLDKILEQSWFKTIFFNLNNLARSCLSWPGSFYFNF